MSPAQNGAGTYRIAYLVVWFNTSNVATLGSEWVFPNRSGETQCATQRVRCTPYTDSVVNGYPDLSRPYTVGTGTTLVISHEPFGPPVSAGPFGQDILDGLRNAPRGNVNKDYLGGVTIADGLTGLGNLGSVFTS